MTKRRNQRLSTKAMVLIVGGCAFLCLACVGYLHEKTIINGLGKQIKGLELRLEKMQTENQALERTYATMCSPRELDLRVRQMNLGLAAPSPEQIVRMPEPVALSGERKAVAQMRLAQGEGREGRPN